ncbi:E3 ubiquitin-protein ligase At1g12760-like [Diospyros lotus]|uniref:E3 ubiquitin-protein ligase At1g12760-like n=1 Tax=Diospyros lotus TaxID=55363 RepID=UPI00225AE0D1|nr:E3 ubiquitin-protein ligase At1g12760-like [Diospyros lotus]
MSALSLPITCLDSDNHCHPNSAADPPQLDGYDDYWDGGYSKPFVVLDFVWNLAFVLVSVFVLLTTIREKPSTPLRVWIAGYSSLCLLHVGFVYQRINHTVFGYQQDGLLSSHSQSSTVKRLESMNAVISSIWWVFGFYWIVMGGQALLQDSPRLYWLAVVFLAFDVFFVMFCIVIASVVFFALFCCLPVVAAVAYAMTITEGASEDDIRTLPKYKYRQANPLMSSGNNRKQEPVELIIESGSCNSMPELALHPDDSECCICLHQYVEGSELCTLPCKHHFHCACISKWLRINATCPLCKLDILRGDSLV